MNILVTGAAGYIGSILSEELIKRGYVVVALDNLQQGHRAAIHPEATFACADLGDSETLKSILREHHIDAVMHMAAETLVADSASDPRRYFRNNVCNGLNLLDAMVACDVDKLVFSSTAAVYGEPKRLPIREDDPLEPVNAYGESKLVFERISGWYHQAHGLQYMSLRYFNAAGASERFGEHHIPETHLIPLVLQVALGRCEHVQVYGTDYATPDGTCIRDYIHVIDLARAHALALQHLDSLGARVYNLGNGNGYSVLEVIETARKVTAHPILAKSAPRRPGDPARLVASSERIRDELGWVPRYRDLHTIIESAWRWHQAYPRGYEE